MWIIYVIWASNFLSKVTKWGPILYGAHNFENASECAEMEKFENCYFFLYQYKRLFTEIQKA